MQHVPLKQAPDYPDMYDGWALDAIEWMREAEGDIAKVRRKIPASEDALKYHLKKNGWHNKGKGIWEEEPPNPQNPFGFEADGKKAHSKTILNVPISTQLPLPGPLHPPYPRREPFEVALRDARVQAKMWNDLVTLLENLLGEKLNP